MTIITESERDAIGNFAHRAHLFTQSLEEGNYPAALKLVREYEPADERVIAALQGYWNDFDFDEFSVVQKRNMTNALRAANEVAR